MAVAGRAAGRAVSPYEPRFIAVCECGWYNREFEERVAATSARVHGLVKPGHVASVYPIADWPGRDAILERISL